MSFLLLILHLLPCRLNHVMSRHVVSSGRFQQARHRDMSRRHSTTCPTCHMTCQEDTTRVASDDMSCRRHMQHSSHSATIHTSSLPHPHMTHIVARNGHSIVQTQDMLDLMDLSTWLPASEQVHTVYTQDRLLSLIGTEKFPDSEYSTSFRSELEGIYLKSSTRIPPSLQTRLVITTPRLHKSWRNA